MTWALSTLNEGFNKRRIHEDSARKWGIGVGEMKGVRVAVFNYRDKLGVLKAQKLRFPGKDFKVLGEGKGMPLFGCHLWGDTRGRHIVVTEGEWDAVSVAQVQDHRWPVVSIPNGASSAKRSIAANREWLLQWPSVVLAFDGDEKGLQAAKEAAEALPAGRAKIVTWPEGIKDASDLLQAGRGSEIIECIWNARKYRPDGIVYDDEAWDLVVDTVEGESVEYPWTAIQVRTKGLRRKELVTITAGSGIGKSAVCRELAANLINYGEKVGYIALEESVRRTVLGLLGVFAESPLHLQDTLDLGETHEDYQKHLQGKCAFLNHFGSTESGSLLSKVRYMISALECTFVILDHLSIVVSDNDMGDERKAIDTTMTQLRSLVQETGAGVVLVCHLKRPSGESFEEGARPTLAHLRGSQSIGQLSDIVVGLQRDLMAAGDDKNTTRLWVLKNRYTGDTGDAGYLRYNTTTGRLMEIPEPLEDIPEGDF